MKSHRWVNSQGETIQATIKDFSAMTNIRASNCRTLACGLRHTLHGWLSPNAPKARRKRFTTVLRNIRTNERAIVGKSLTSFAERHNVCANDLWKVVNGRKLAAKGWVLESSVKLAHGGLADGVS
jgi:hypothetical protein